MSLQRGNKKASRQKIIRLRVNDEEDAKLRVLADKSNLSVSGYLRKLFLDEEAKDPVGTYEGLLRRRLREEGVI